MTSKRIVPSTLWRTLFLCATGVFLTSFLSPQVALTLTIPVIFAAVASTSYLLWHGRSPLKVTLINISIALIIQVISAELPTLAFYLSLTGFLPELTNPASFALIAITERLNLLNIVYLGAGLTTVLYWRFRAYATFELLGLALVFFATLSPHQNYNLDALTVVSDIAWASNIELTSAVIILSACLFLLLAVYAAQTTFRPVLGERRRVYSRHYPSWLKSILLVSLVLSAFAAFIYQIREIYGEASGQSSNGVGQHQGEDKSPLGFHSAVGKTKQPSALIRFDSDFTENPWRPMLYLRDGALSRFNGTEMVDAGNNFDTDAPRIPAGTRYSATATTTGTSQRREVSISFYLLTDHRSAVALDFPVQIKPLKNPDPQKFQLAYQAVSLAPTVPLLSMIGEDTDNPFWSAEQREQYLRAPGSKSSTVPDENVAESKNPVLDEFGEDLRYKALAFKLTKDEDTPLPKAMSIIRYLSKESLYTRAPGHKVADKQDPVAPYLFSSEKRGYCVHFAHAATYMLRLSGIPARIATGYLTSLKYARDGHILLHLGDKHAWPEIYVTGIGWVVVDVTPEHAENESEIVPDDKLLEELMSKIDPGSELLQEFDEESENKAIGFS
ncbi:MAG: transglutaminase domain-containing protein, partial [bacterium]|nr:transglutaminase domain-containing protein [bacterium]